MIIILGLYLYVERLSNYFIQWVIFVYQESKKIWKRIPHFIQKYVINDSLGHYQTL